MAIGIRQTNYSISSTDYSSTEDSPKRTESDLESLVDGISSIGQKEIGTEETSPASSHKPYLRGKYAQDFRWNLFEGGLRGPKGAWQALLDDNYVRSQWSANYYADTLSAGFAGLKDSAKAGLVGIKDAIVSVTAPNWMGHF